MISYENYTEYDSLESLDLSFIGKPSKNKLTNVYTLSFTEPIHLAIPQSKIIEIYQNNQNNYLFQYVIDDFELLQFLNNIDTKVINIAQNKSSEWFNRQLSHKQLIKLYDSILYEEEVYKLLDISINAQNIEEVLEDMSEYNEDEIDNITISLVGIEFYRKTFKLCIELTSIEYTSGDESDNENNEEDNEDAAELHEEENIGDELNSQKNQDEEEDLDLEILMSKNETDVNYENDINSQTDNEIDSCDLNSDTETVLEDVYNTNVSIDKNDKDEILEMIRMKEKEQEKYRINSERAKEASASLDDMASNLNDEILKYKSELKKYT